MVRGYPRKPRYTYPQTFSKILWTTPLPHTRVSFVMPNHTANNFTITGPKDTILAFIERAKDKNPDELDPQELSFNSLLPLPKELKGIASPVRIMTQDQIDEVWAEWNERKSQDKLGTFEKNGPFGLGLTREQSEELIKIGYVGARKSLNEDDGDRDGEIEELGLIEDDGESEGDIDAEGEMDGDALGEIDALAEAEGDMEADGLADALGEIDALIEIDGDTEVEGEMLALSDAEGLIDAEGEILALTLTELS